ncbi:hypothetical protein DFH28DRAFT_1117487 [Melampsora americana]|nr:hypothetical protein DFH28DRAFT_1117487 [Melampsora americana]
MSLNRRITAPLPPALYIDCDVGSLAEICVPEEKYKKTDNIVESLSNFTPEPLFYTTGTTACKFTSWTESNGKNVTMSPEIFGEIIKQTKDYCKSMNIPVPSETTPNFYNLRNVFVGTTNDGQGIVMQWTKIKPIPSRV